jgi:hypothetical protein
MAELPEKRASNMPVLPPRSPSGEQDDGEHSHAENDGGDPGNFDVGSS